MCTYSQSRASKEVSKTHCYNWGLGLSGLSTYQLWLWYKVCHSVLIMDSCISQQQCHMYDSMTHSQDPCTRMSHSSDWCTRVYILQGGASKPSLYIDSSTKTKALQLGLLEQSPFLLYTRESSLRVTLSRLSYSSSGIIPCNLCSNPLPQVPSCPGAYQRKPCGYLLSPTVIPQSSCLSQAYAR